MAKGTYKLARVQGGPGTHELRNGKVVTYDQAQEFDPAEVGLQDDWVVLVSPPSTPAPAPATRKAAPKG